MQAQRHGRQPLEAGMDASAARCENLQINNTPSDNTKLLMKQAKVLGDTNAELEYRDITEQQCE